MFANVPHYRGVIIVIVVLLSTAYAAAEPQDNRLIELAQRFTSATNAPAAITAPDSAHPTPETRDPTTEEKVALRSDRQTDITRQSTRNTPTPDPRPQTPDPVTQTLDPSPSPDFESTPLGARAATPANAPAATKSNSPKYRWLIQTVAALGAVIGLILFLRALLSRATGRAPAVGRCSAVEVLTRVSLAPRNHLLLIRLGRRIVVVGESPSGLATLADITDGEEVADLLQSVTASRPGSATHGFAQLMRRFNGEYRGRPGDDDDDANDDEYQVDRARDSVSGLVGRVRSLAGKGAAP